MTTQPDELAALRRQVIALTAQVEEQASELTALRTQERVLKNIVQTIPYFVFWKDRHSVYQGCNEAFARAAGVASPADIVGKTDFELAWKRSEAEYFVRVDQEVMRTKTPQLHFEEPQRQADGSERVVLTSKVPLIANDGSIAGILGVYTDITERKRLETELKEAKDAAEAANRAKSAFLANMSHELRTPLHAILGFVQLMQHDATDPREHERLSIIERSGFHLLDLINEVLDLSKIEAGSMELRMIDVDLYNLFADVERLFRPRAEEKGLLFTVTLAAEVPRCVRSDGSKLRQLILNLVSNAIKFTERGQITVTANVSGARADAQPQLCVEVRDTGPGLLPEEIELLFQPFTRTRAGQRLQEGAGLGLAICQRVIELFGGDLRARPGEGGGAVFSFAVPFADGTSRRQEPSRRVVGLLPGTAAARLLVVEDNAVNRMLLVELLQTAGFTVYEAENGAEALTAWRTHKPDFIWMDMLMPVMDGAEAVRQIRADPAGRSLPIVALTASAFQDEYSAILEAGCTDILMKPIREHEVFECLARYLGVQYRYEDAVSEESDPARS